MPTLHESYKRATLDGPLDLVDLGSTNAAGALVWRTGADAELATNRLGNPAFANAAINGTEAEADANTITDDASITAGTIGKLQLVNRDDLVLSEWTVSGPSGGGEVILTNPVLPPGAASMQVEAFVVAHAFA